MFSADRSPHHLPKTADSQGTMDEEGYVRLLSLVLPSTTSNRLPTHHSLVPTLTTYWHLYPRFFVFVFFCTFICARPTGGTGPYCRPIKRYHHQRWRECVSRVDRKVSFASPFALLHPKAWAALEKLTLPIAPVQLYRRNGRCSHFGRDRRPRCQVRRGESGRAPTRFTLNPTRTHPPPPSPLPNPQTVGVFIGRSHTGSAAKPLIPASVRSHVRESMSGQSAPEWVWFLGEDGIEKEMPKTASGKIQKVSVRGFRS